MESALRRRWLTGLLPWTCPMIHQRKAISRRAVSQALSVRSLYSRGAVGKKNSWRHANTKKRERLRILALLDQTSP